MPKIKRIAVIQNPNNAESGVYLTAIDEAVSARRVNLKVLDVRSGDQLDSAFKQAAGWAQGVIVIPETLVRNNRGQITALAARYRLPAVYGSHELVRAGGLMAYAPEFAPFMVRAAELVDKILKGTRPGDIPVEQYNQNVLTVNIN